MKQMQETKDFGLLPLLDVYVAEIPEVLTPCEVYPNERAQEINSCKHERVKREKQFVWQLLGHSVERSFGKKLEEFGLFRTENGKWESDGFFFSLSHSNGIAAVAVSSKPVGVDVELFDVKKMLRLSTKMLTQSEKQEASAFSDEDFPQFLIEKWTQKESFFKIKGEGAFLPWEIAPCNVKSIMLEQYGRKYCLSVASEYVEQLRVNFLN